MDAEDFWDLNNKSLFLELKKRLDSGREINIAELDATRVLTQNTMAGLISAYVMPGSWRVQLGLLRESRQVREFERLAEELADKCDRPLTTTAELVTMTRRRLDEAVRLMGDAFNASPDSYLDDYEARVRNWRGVPLLRTGIAALDAAIGGGVLPGGVLSLVGGEGSMKTSLALSAAETYIREVKRPVLYLSLDMEGERLALRRLLPLLDAGEIEANRIIDREPQRFEAARRQRQELDHGLFLLKAGPQTLNDLRRYLQVLEPGLVIVDYLTAFSGYRSELEAMRAFCASLREWKTRFQASWLVLNQMSENSKADQRRGDIAGRSSGGNDIARVADTHIELFRDAPGNAGAPAAPPLIATVVKCRTGISGGSWDLEYLGKTMTFTGLAKKMERKKPRGALFQGITF